MRLTGQIKLDLVSKIIQDIPEVDYNKEIQSLCQEDAIENLPYELRQIINKDRNKLLPYLRQEYYSRPYRCAVSNMEWKPTEEFRKKIELLMEKAEEQSKKRRELSRELAGLFSPITTDTQFRKMFPEFEKYLPKAEEVKHLPVSNTIKKLVDAGWRQDGGE